MYEWNGNKKTIGGGFLGKYLPIQLRGESLLELWDTDWQPPLIFVRIISNLLFMSSNGMTSAHVILK